MKETIVSRMVIICFAATLILMTAFIAATAAQGQAGRNLFSGTSNPAGLAMDSRCNIYTVDKKTGHVFCIPPDSVPVLLASVEGAPTTLAVDRFCNVFVGTQGGQIFIVEQNGNVTEAYKCRSRPVGLSIDRDGALVIATEKGNIIRINRRDLAWAK